MQLLLDECVPRLLGPAIGGHEVSHVADHGWQGVRNGRLLELMAASSFADLVTVDKNLSFQQKVSSTGLFIVVLVAKTDRRKELLPLVPQLLCVLAFVQPGQVVRVGA